MFLYPQTKGQLEQTLSSIGFHRLSIFRPGFLQGRGSGRLAEDLTRPLVPLIEWMAPRKYVVSCEQVARAMQVVAMGSGESVECQAILDRPGEAGVHETVNPAGTVAIYSNEDIVVLAGKV